jgi:hypothetical protein
MIPVAAAAAARTGASEIIGASINTSGKAVAGAGPVRQAIGKAASAGAREMQKNPVPPGIGGWAAHKVAKFAGEPVNSTLNLSWAIQNLINFGENWLPRMMFATSVKIWGNPTANYGQLYYLAVALAQGLTPNPFDIAASGKSFSVTFVPHKMYIELSLVYQRGGLLGQINQAIDANAATELQAQPPSQFVAQNSWPAFFGDGPNLLPGVAPGATQLIGTLSPAANPYPPYDELSRTNDFVALLTAALLGPCTPPQPASLINSQYQTDNSNDLTLPGSDVTVPQVQPVGGDF